MKGEESAPCKERTGQAGRADAGWLVCSCEGLGGFGDDAELAHEAQSIPIDEAFDDLAVGQATDGYAGDGELLVRGRNAVELALVDAAAGPTSHNGFAFGKEVFDVQTKIVEGGAIEVDSFLLTLRALAKIGCGIVMVQVHGGNKFIRDQQIALIPKFIKETADDSFILFRHGVLLLRDSRDLAARGEPESQGGLELLASCV